MRILAGATATLRRALDVLLIVLILVVVFGVVLGKLVPLTGRQTIIVGGRSMEPALTLGSAFVIGSVSPSQLAVGDVVTLRAGAENAIYTHRIVEVLDRPDGRWVRTKGDSNGEPDPTIIHSSAIMGRLEFAVPYMGFVLTLLSIPSGIAFLLGLGATLLAAAWLLETLELGRSDRVAVILKRAMDGSIGEPIAIGQLGGPPLLAQGSFAGRARAASVAQFAIPLATREQRHRWAAIRARRLDRRRG
jgi:signal peptidase